MSSIFVIVVVVSFLFGVRKPLYGCIAGTIAAGISYYLFIENFDLLIFFIVIVVGLLLSLLAAYFSSWFFSKLDNKLSDFGAARQASNTFLIFGFELAICDAKALA